MDRRTSLVEQHAEPKPVTQSAFDVRDALFELPEVLIDCPDNVGVCCLSSFANCCTPCLEGIAVARDVANDFIEEA